eukprot:scaffold46943_cov191-Amphora_coffeaeformis.AAC.5
MLANVLFRSPITSGSQSHDGPQALRCGSRRRCRLSAFTGDHSHDSISCSLKFLSNNLSSSLKYGKMVRRSRKHDDGAA